MTAARRRYVEALVRRAAADPRDPDYHELVHEVGVSWSLVQMWQRKVELDRWMTVDR